MRVLHGVLLLLILSSFGGLATAQVMSIPTTGYGGIGTDQTGPGFGSAIGLNSVEANMNNLWSLTNNPQSGASPLQSPSGSVSKLDLKAPTKAQKEYSKGYQLLMQKDYKGAVEHLQAALNIYSDFVSARNALGSTYLGLGDNDKAREQFAKAVALDDHLPTSFLNLGCAQLALKDYPAAEESVKKAASLAPLDLQLETALAYAQFSNRDFDGVIATAKHVHSRQHKGAGIVHYFAAAAFDGQNNLPQAKHELETLLHEDPKSPAAEEARKILAQIKVEQIVAATRGKQVPTPAQHIDEPTHFEMVGPTPEQLAAQHQLELQKARQEQQIAEAEKLGMQCENCNGGTSSEIAATGPSEPKLREQHPAMGSTPFALRSVVEEVAVFFAATDHGKSVTDLTQEEIGIRDNKKSPAIITGFRNEAQLPLRLGIVIDTSESITRRFGFEQHAAVDFLQKVVNKKDDLAFVVGVANSVLMVQDFTDDQKSISRAIDQLAPSGGTALWDAVSFAADKIANHPETQPVARMLVVISDGEDNSSLSSLKEAIEVAEHGEVFVYTVSTREANDTNLHTTIDSATGDHALKLLADLTGGAAFMPGSLNGLNHSLDELQQVIRSRYLISYRPALFKRDGRFRAIEITANKSGRKLHVYSRRGYYARVNDASAPNVTQ